MIEGRARMERLRVIILTQYYPPEIGAPQARLHELTRALVAAGHDTVVLTAMPSYPVGRVYDGYGGLFRRESRDGADVLRTWAYANQSPALIKRLANYLSFVFSSLVGGLLFLPKADYLICESPPVFLGLTAFTLSAAKGARWIFNVSDLWTDTAVRVNALSEGWKLRLAVKLEASCYRRAWRVSGQSREITSLIEDRHRGVRTYHFSNGVNVEMFDPALRTEEARRELGFDPYCVVLYSGLHGLAQGLMQVLEAARLLKDEAGLRFVLIGDGPEKQKLIVAAQRMGLDNVEFRDPAPREQMPRVVCSADIGLVPLKSRIPGAVPSKLYEAMGCGIPVVLAAAGEPADIVESAGCGLVAPPGDAQAMAAAIRQLARDPAARARLGRAGRRAAEEQFNRKVISAKFIEFLTRNLSTEQPSCPVRP